MSVKSLKAYLVLALMMCAGTSARANITVTFSEGDLPKMERYGSATGQPNVLFDDVTVDVDTTISGCLILPGRSTSTPKRTYVDTHTGETVDLVDFYGCVVDNGGGTLKLSGLNRLDSETYYFKKDYNTAGAATLANDLANRTDTLWAYTFTGWYIKDASPLVTLQHNDVHVPAQTVFQPGDVITPDILARNRVITRDTLELVALWGKCCFVGHNGSLSNLGNDRTTPCTLDSITGYTTKIADRFCNYDAFMQVAMLVDVDTIRGSYNDSNYGITYKSLQTTDGNTFELHKEHGNKTNYYNKCNWRLDNVYITQNYNRPIFNYDRAVAYIETTARLSNQTYNYLLYVQHTDNGVFVCNGGRSFGPSVYACKSNTKRYVYIGRKFWADGTFSINAGIADGEFYYIMTGGYDQNWLLGNARTCAIDQYFYFYGDKSGNSEYDPETHRFYPAYGTFNTTTHVLINGCTQLKDNIFGGTGPYTTKVENVDLKIYNSTINGDIFGGGEYGTVTGNVKIKIQGTTVPGSVFGCARGATSQSNGPNGTIDMSKPPTDFPKYYSIAEGGFPQYSVHGYKYNYMQVSNGDVAAGNVSSGVRSTSYFLSVAESGSIDIDISESIIKGNVYGGGSIARVKGNSTVKITNSTVHGSIYGGGDGITTPAGFVVDFPIEQSQYTAPIREEALSRGNYGCSYQHPNPNENTAADYITNQLGYHKYCTIEYNWTGDTAVLNAGGFDHTNRLAYSPNGKGWGDIYGSTTVTIIGGTVKGSVYGGGNAGRVGYNSLTDVSTGGGTTLTIDGTTVEGSVYGGCNQANVGGNINLTVSPGTVVKGKVCSGNNDSGTIAGDVTSTISANAKTIYGGGYGEKTNVGGSVNLMVSSSTVTGDVYAGSALGNVNAKYDTDSVLVATSGATTNVTLTNNTINGDVYGGCLGQQADTTVTPAVPAIEAKVFGPVTVNFNSGSARNVFGCNNLNGAPQSTVNVNIAGGTVTSNVYGGGNLAPYAAPAATPNYPLVNVTGGKTGSVFGGGYGATAILTGNPQVSATGGTVTGSLYGGGNAAAVKGNPSVKVNAGKVNGNVFGGGLGTSAKVTGNTKVSVSNGSVINGDVFGGGNAANVKGGTNVKITGTTTKVDGSVFGGGNEANVSGPTYVQVGGRPLP